MAYSQGLPVAYMEFKNEQIVFSPTNGRDFFRNDFRLLAQEIIGACKAGIKDEKRERPPVVETNEQDPSNIKLELSIPDLQKFAAAMNSIGRFDKAYQPIATPARA